MAIFYAVVARGDVILAHHASTSGNFITIVTFLLNKMSKEDTQVTYSYDRLDIKF